jgi:dipeptidyl aminopeptidase/acylaminoacyl peptidase
MALKKWILACLFFGGVTSGSFASPLAPSRAFRPDDHYRIRTAVEARISPDGSRVAFVERSIDRDRNRTRSQIWLLSLADQTTQRLSHDEADDSSPRWSPDGTALAFLSTKISPDWQPHTGSADFQPQVGGGAQSMLVVVRVDTGQRDIVATYDISNDPLAYLGVGDQLSWSPDGRAIAYLSADPGPEPPPGDPIVLTRYSYKSWATMQDNRRWHIHVVTLSNKKVKQLTDGPYHEHSIAWSPSGKEIAFISNRGPDPDRVHNFDLFAVSVDAGKVRRITDTQGCEYTPAWSSDGKMIAYRAGTRAVTTKESSAEDPHLWVIPAAGGPARELATDLDRRVMAIAWAPDEAIVYFTVEDHGDTVLYRVRADGENLEPAVAETGRVHDFSAAESRALAFTFTAVDSPAEVFVKRGGQPPRQMSQLNAELLEERDVSVSEAFEFDSFDGTRVQGFLTPPLGREPGRAYPLILQIHGGPHGQQGPHFTHRAQVYAGLGWATVMINYRGSSGYGQKFADGTVGDQNGDEFKDLMAGLDYILGKTPYLDPARLAVEGGSYGGQLTNWAVTQTTRFKAAISRAGISNLITLAYTIWAQDYIQVEFGGHPWEKDIAAFMWKRSPLAHVAKVETPVLFIHGEEDQDVSIVEAEQMYNALQQRKVETMFVRYPREGHGLREPAHAVDGLERSIAWYERFLGVTEGTQP